MPGTAEKGALDQRYVFLGSEQSTTPVAGANDTVINTTNRRYAFFTLPTTAALYMITAIEWLNGTVVNGSVMAQVEKVDANPPVSAIVSTYAWIPLTTQTGTSVVQRAEAVSLLIPGGTICGVFLSSNSATGRFGTTTIGSQNQLKAVVTSTDPTMGNSTSWAAGTETPYVKVYYKAVL